MKYTNLLVTLFICFFSTFLHAQSTLNKTIYFDHDKHELSTDSKEVLEALAADLATYTDYNLEVIGHADQDGAEEYNLLLSQNRAETVSGYLASEGLSPEKMSVSYYGESIPLQSSSSTVAKSQNRRVTIRAEVFNYSNIKEMVSQILPEQLQLHTVSQLKETKITLSQGTEVTIPPEAFCHLDGSPINTDEVQLTCNEVYTYADMIDERLFTQTTDQMLETGGMIYMEASFNGEELRLQDGKSIEIKLPEQGVVKDMEVFEGLEDSSGTIWSETGTKVAVIKEEPFVQIDLSPLFDFVFEDTSNVNLTMGEMSDFPRPLRIAYPPNKKAYSEEEYKKVYQMYEDVMEAHHKDKEDLYERQLLWHAEAKRRTELI